MRIGIIGSRSFPRLDQVEAAIVELPSGCTVISGGAKGVDSIAASTARSRGIYVIEHLPNLEGCSRRHEFTKRFYERNQKIVDDCDSLIAFTEKESGGTWDSIKRARKAGKPVRIVRPE